MNPIASDSLDGFIRSLEGMLRCVVQAELAPNCGTYAEFRAIEDRWFTTATWHAGALLIDCGISDSLQSQYATLARRTT